MQNKFEMTKVGVVEAAASAKADVPSKNLFKDTQEKIKTLLVHSKIFDSSIKKFPSNQDFFLIFLLFFI